MNNQQTSLTIGDIAKAAAVGVETIRYYQRKGLIAVPTKPLQGFRKYPQEVVNIVRFIKRAQKLGFSLSEIAELLELGSGHCNDVRAHAEKKRDTIEKQIRDLQALHSTLNSLIDKCGASNKNHPCPIVESLLDEGI